MAQQLITRHDTKMNLPRFEFLKLNGIAGAWKFELHLSQ
jgi:hypothetical protein